VRRLGALLEKELLDIRRNRAALVPVLIVALVFLLLPFIVIVMVPSMTGKPLGDDPQLTRLSGVARLSATLDSEGRIQLFLFQQFLMFFLMLPITGAMALAAHAVIGEKQARTLEPLLATPLTTLELLVAKMLGALLPTLAISIVSLLLYAAGIAWLARPGVFGALLTGRSVLLVGLLGPASALVALQGAVLVSSRVNDPRTAQQFSVLIIVPLTGVLVAQFAGLLWLSAWAIGAIGAGLLLTWFLLTMFSVAMFQREVILTRWK